MVSYLSKLCDDKSKLRLPYTTIILYIQVEQGFIFDSVGDNEKPPASPQHT